MIRGWVLGLATCAAMLVTAPAAASDVPVFRLHDSEITESSALVISRTDPRLAYTVDDSGDAARVFTVDTRSGETVGVTTLAGVENIDFEALAFAPGGRLLVGDIGDNDAERGSVQVHMIDEPGHGDATVQPQTLELTYTDGPRDAEALLVHQGRILVVSKRVLGGQVYRGPLLREFPATGVLRPVAKAPGTVTDATVLGDGRVVLRNYTAAFVMTSGWDIAQTLMLPRTELGESSAAPPEGSWLLAGTEGEDAPVYRIDVPEADRGEPSLMPSAAPPPQPPPEPPADPPPEQDQRSGGDLVLWVGGGLLLAGLTLLAIRRRR